MSLIGKRGRCFSCGYDHGENGFGDQRMLDAVKRIAELESENEALHHDIERHIANHAADLNATQGADARPVASKPPRLDDDRFIDLFREHCRMCGEWQIINFGRAIEREVTALVEREFAKRSIKNYPIYQAGRMDATRDASHQPSASATADAKPADGVLSDALTDALAEIERLNAIINTPHADDFMRSVSIEAEHQRQRWGAEGDAGKTPADWFWLVGYLAGKALHSHAAGNVEKGEHHVITTAAACANWHRALFGKTDMRPGHEEGSGLLVAAQPEGEGS